jgi:hypothetical protein
MEESLELVRSIFRRPRGPWLSELDHELTPRGLFALYDIFYVCFDEPNREANWQSIQRIFPKAKKVEGILGFDRALKTCARRSRTRYFFLIDGDNVLLPQRFDNPLKLQDPQDQWVLSWSSLNPVNGLIYGNGGVKLWPRSVAFDISSHENASEEDDQTDYCFIADYYMVDDFISETQINTTYRQAFRAGFREGVKMSLEWGRQVDLDEKNFDRRIGRQNRQRLKIWCEIGNDSINGCWAVLGARLGLIKNVIEKFPYESINYYQWIDNYLEKEVLPYLGVSEAEVLASTWSKKTLLAYMRDLRRQINEKLPMGLRDYSAIESLRFKQSFQNPSRQGLLGRNPRL